MEVMNNKLLRYIFFTVILGSILGAAYLFPRLALPFGFAYVLSLILKPLIKQFYSQSFEKKVIAVLIGVVGVFILAYPLVVLINTIGTESSKMDQYIPRLEAYLRAQYASFKTELLVRFNYEITFNPVDKLITFGQESTKIVVSYIPKIVASTLEWIILVPLFLFFIIKDEKKFKFMFLKVVPNGLVERFYYLYHQFNTKFGEYIFAKFIEASIVGIIITTGLLIMGYPFPVILGLVAAVTNILPYIGPVLGFIPALIIGLVDQSLTPIFTPMIILYLIANIIDLAFVFPILVSRVVNLHPVIVVISVVVGSQFGGAIGMIVSIPFAAFLILLVQEIYREIYSRN